MQLTGGLTAAPTLMRVLDRMSEAPYGERPSPDWYVALARALKAAYAERLAGLGDAEPNAAETCTTHLTVCDAEGTMVALTSTLLSTMGSRVVLPTSGVLMNNGVMWFDPTPGRPNSVAPGKRPLTNMLPIILRDGERPWIAAGASGGRRILAAVFQTLTLAADFGMTLEAAAHHPRIDVSDAEKVSVDRRMPASIIAALKADGPTEVVEHGTMPINFACPEPDRSAWRRQPDRDQRPRLALVGGGRPRLKPRVCETEDPVNLRVWGARGGLPVPGAATTVFGGNTSCIELRCGSHVLILDAGSGLRGLGQTLRPPFVADLLLTHTHLDHVCGLPFFAPMFQNGTKVRLWGGHLPRQQLLEALTSMLSPPLMPDLLGALPAPLHLQHVHPGRALHPEAGHQRRDRATQSSWRSDWLSGVRRRHDARLCY